MQSEIKSTPNTVLLKKERRNQEYTTSIKSSYIQDLEQRNQRLRMEIAKIKDNLKEMDESTGDTEHKLIPFESQPKVIQKELENAYKQVKMYQKEIQRLQNKQSGGLLPQKMSRLESILQEKNVLIDKLQREVLHESKSTSDNSRKLKDNTAKEELENQIIKFNQEIKYLREKVREAQNRQAKKAQNSKKQLKYIRSLQERILSIGVQANELQVLKSNNIFAQIFQKNLGQRRAHSSVGKSTTSIQKVQQRTLEKYQELKNQIKLFNKLHGDYQHKLQQLRINKQQSQAKIKQCNSELESKVQEILDLEQLIKQLKSKVNKANLKPTFAPSDPSQHLSKKNNQKNKKQFITRMKSRSTQEPMVVPPHLKYDEKGLAGERATKFSDRPMLGKIYTSRIISVKIWVEKNTFAICGIQCIYNVASQGKNKLGGQFLKPNKDLLNEMKFDCPPGDYIKTISGSISSNNVIQYLVFISRQSKIARFGAVRPGQKQFTFDIDQTEMPICLYGAWETRNDRPLSALTFLGFQIAKDDIPPPPL